MTQRSFGAARWLPEPADSDESLARRGFKLAGLGFDFSALSDEEGRELDALLAMPKEEQEKPAATRERELLAKCKVAKHVPPLDLDFAEGATPGDKLDAVRRLDAAILAQGKLGKPRWCTTGGSGVHGDLELSGTVASLAPIRVLVRAAAEAAGIPLLSEHRPVKGRPLVVLDDSMFERLPGSRGVMWRLFGAKHTLGGTKGRLGGLSLVGVPWRPSPVPFAVEELPPEVAALETPARAALAAKTPKAVAAVAAPGILGRVVAVLKKVRLASNRHFAHLALAGALLGAGVPSPTVRRTLESWFGWEKEAREAVRDTLRKLEQGLPITGWPSVARLLGAKAKDAVADALAVDLKACGIGRDRLPEPSVSPHAWASRERARHWEVDNAGVEPPPIKGDGPQGRRRRKAATKSWEASEIGHPGRLSKIARAGLCGRAVVKVRCAKCKGAVCACRVACESTACPWCVPTNFRAILRWIDKAWPETFWVADRPAHSKTVGDACYAVERGDNIDADLDGTCRNVIAPGIGIRVSDADIKVGANAKFVTRAQGIRELEKIFAAYAWHVHDLAHAPSDPESFAAYARSEWLTPRLKLTTCGKQALEAFPWPSREELRAEAKLMAKERKAKRAEESGTPPVADDESPCCRFPLEFMVEVLGKPVTQWEPTRIRSDDALVLASGGARSYMYSKIRGRHIGFTYSPDDFQREG